MEKLTVGSVVLVTFPFSDLRGQKVRPALLLSCVEFDNVILCQITSKDYSSSMAIPIEHDDFRRGKLPVNSFARPDKLFTADPSIITKIAGELRKDKIQEILKTVRELFIS